MRITHKSFGFTLIELLVVIVIISIVAGFAVISINVNQTKRMETLSKRIINLLTLAQQEALLRSTTLGFGLSPTSYQFYEYVPPQSEDDSPWQPITTPVLGKHAIPNDIRLQLKVEGKVVQSSLPAVIISSNGDMTPFVIYIGKITSSPRYKIIGSAAGDLRSEQVNAE